jgi:uncharacterized repeat protein (TIGR01451 family)
VGQATLTLRVLVDSTAAAISNTATVTSPIDLRFPAPDTAAVNTTVVPAQDLTLQKSGPVRAAQSQTLSYRLTVNNPGPDRARNVEVTDDLPSGTTFVSASAPAGWTVTVPAVGSTGTVRFTHASLDPGATLLELTVRVGDMVLVDTIITNEATIASENDSNPDNNTASRATTVSAGSDLAVTQTVSPATPRLGDMVTFSLVVTNHGPSPATGVQATVLLPDGLSLKSATPSLPGAYSGGLWTIGALTAEADATLTLTVQVDALGVFTLRTTDLQGNQTDPDTTNNHASTTLTVSTADIALTASVDQAAPRVGDTVTITLTATNNGPNAVTQLQVDDTLPIGLALVAADPATGTIYDPATGIWQIPGLSVGASTTLGLAVRVGTSGTLTTEATATVGDPTDPMTSNNKAAATLTATPTADLVVTKTVNQLTADALFSTVAFTVTVENRGPWPATGVIVDDVLPSAFFPTPEFAGLGFPAPMSAPSLGTYDIATGRWDVGTLDATERATLLIVTRVYAPGTTTNTAQARSTEPDDPDLTNNAASASVRTLENDIAITKTVDNPTPPLGGLVTYTIRLTNLGPDTAEFLDVRDVVTRGSTTFVSATITQGVIDPAFHPPEEPALTMRRWSLPVLPAGASETLTLVERVTSLGPLTNEASCLDVGIHSEFNLGNNVAAVTVEVQPTADIAVSKTVSATPPAVGDTVLFTVTATNRGAGDATGVQVSDGLPAGLTLLSSTLSQGTYDAATGVWTVGTVATGAAATLELAARVDQAGGLTNVAVRTAADQFDPDPSDNAGGVTLTGQPSADIQLLQTVDNPAPNVEDTVTFTLTVTNAGPTAATGVQVTDPLPAGLTLVSATPSQGTYTAGIGVWDIGALAHGGRVTLDLVATVTRTGTVTALATKTAQGEDDPVRANDASGAVLNGQQADLQVLKIVDRTVPAVGDLVTFTVTVTNNGPSAATGIVVTDALSAGITVRAGTPSQGTYTATTGVWAVGSLASSGAAAPAPLQIVGQVSQAGTWTNLATRTAQDQADPNPLNDQGTATIRALFTAPPPQPPEANTPPVATDDEVPTPVDAPVTIAVLGNDRDPDGDPLTVVAVT